MDGNKKIRKYNRNLIFEKEDVVEMLDFLSFLNSYKIDYKKNSTELPQLFIDGKPVVIQPDPYTIAVCPFTTPAGNPLPCVTVVWVKASIKIMTDFIPVLLTDSQANTIPNATRTANRLGKNAE